MSVTEWNVAEPLMHCILTMQTKFNSNVKVLMNVEFRIFKMAAILKARRVENLYQEICSILSENTLLNLVRY